MHKITVEETSATLTSRMILTGRH